MNIIKRLFMKGKGQKRVRSSLSLGIFLLLFMVMSCVFGSFLLPMDAYESHGDLKNQAPSTKYLSGAKDMDGDDVEKIVSGSDFSLALSKDGKVQSWGNITLDEELKQREDIIDVAAGANTYVLLDADGQLSMPKNKEIDMVLPSAYETTRFLAVAGCDDTFAAISQDHRLYVWGNTQKFPAIPDVYQTRIQAVDLSATHMALLLVDGSLAILGNPGSEIMQLPEAVKTPQAPFVDIALSHQEAIALNANGEVMVWGERIMDSKLDLDVRYTQVAASRDVLFALDEQGNIHTSGQGSFHETEIPQGKYEKVFADYYQIYGIQDEDVEAWGNHGFRFGSDRYGRDLLTRLVHGGLVTMGIGLIACLVEAILGVSIGMLAGYCGGFVDQLLMRGMEVISSLPFLPLVITLSAFLKEQLDPLSRMILIMVLLGVLSAPSLARMIRSQILVEREKAYVEAAQILGANTSWILRKELFPQIVHLLLVHLTLSYADNMLIESSLSFLGFGVQAPYPTWGNMLEGAQSTFVLEHCWWQWVLPAACIVLCVLAVNLIGEALRKRYAPKEGV